MQNVLRLQDEKIIIDAAASKFCKVFEGVKVRREVDPLIRKLNLRNCIKPV